MKHLLLFLILVVAAFVAGFGGGRWNAIELISSRLLQNQRQPAPFVPTPYPIENLPFCVIIVGKNNGAHVEKTLQSAFSQHYDNFRIVYIDDASDDGSAELARDLIDAHPRFALARVYKNSFALGTLGSLASAVRGCADEEIVVVLNGEDWLAHEWVLSRLNQYYADPDLWLTFGESVDYPTYQIGNARPLENGRPVRAQPFSASHLKTFYAGLFKKIDEADLQWEADLAYMFPMLEMARGHSQCLSDILYISNRESHSQEDRELSLGLEKHIRSSKPYPQLASMDFQNGEEGK